MEVTNGQIWTAAMPWEEGKLGPIQEVIRERWPSKTSYWLTRLARKLSEHLRDIEAVRTQVYQQYGESSEDGKTIKPPKDPSKRSAFDASIRDLLNLQVEWLMDKVKLQLPSDDAGEQQRVTVSPQALLLLEPFVEIIE